MNRIKNFIRNTLPFRLTVFAILTLALAACQGPTPPSLRGQEPASTQPEVTAQRLSTPTAPPMHITTPSESAPDDSALPSPTAFPNILTLEVPAMLQISQLRMIDAKTGWAEDTQGRILRTTRGVQFWENISLPHLQGDFDTAAFFFDRSTAVLITTQIIRSPDETKAPKAQIVPWRTANGGQTWKMGETVFIEDVEPFWPFQFYFLNKQHGWLLTENFQSMGQCEAEILETRDGGFHFDLIYRTLTGPPNQPGALFGTCLPTFGREIMAFPSASSGFATDAYEELVASKDGGRTWQPLELERPGDAPPADTSVSIISAPSFSSERDGMLSVRVYDRDQEPDPFYAIFHGLPLAQYLYYTHDAGRTWLPRPAPARIGMVFFLDPHTGWFLGKNDADPSAGTQLYLTRDGGQTWSLIASDTPLPLGTEIQFIDQKNGFAYNLSTGNESSPGIDANPYHELDSRAGAESYLFISQDGGRSWSPVEPQLVP